MTAPDPRLDEIQAREALVHVKCADCAKCRVAEEECWCAECEYWGCERGPDCEDDPNPTDIAYLLAELRKAREALARVEALAHRWETVPALRKGTAAADLRAAVTAAKETDLGAIKSILTGTDCHHEGEQGVQPNISATTA